MKALASDIDGTLVFNQQIKKQDKEAANTLISYYYKEIYAYVYRQTGNEELAKDLTQDIFIQILQKIAMFDHKKGFISDMDV